MKKYVLILSFICSLLMANVSVFAQTKFTNADSVMNFLIGKWEWTGRCGGFTGACTHSDSAKKITIVYYNDPSNPGMLSVVKYQNDTITGTDVFLKPTLKKSIHGTDWMLGLGQVLQISSQNSYSVSDNYPDGFGDNYKRVDTYCTAMPTDITLTSNRFNNQACKGLSLTFKTNKQNNDTLFTYTWRHGSRICPACVGCSCSTIFNSNDTFRNTTTNQDSLTITQNGTAIQNFPFSNDVEVTVSPKGCNDSYFSKKISTHFGFSNDSMPVSPIVKDYTLPVGTSYVTAIGKNMKWYSTLPLNGIDEQKPISPITWIITPTQTTSLPVIQTVASGSPYKDTLTYIASKTGLFKQYVTQTNGTCESEPATIKITISDSIKQPFTIFNDTVIKVQVGNTFNVAIKAGIDKGIQTTTGGVQLQGHQILLPGNTIETADVYDVYDVYTFKAINQGEDVVVWNNGARKILVQIIDTINLKMCTTLMQLKVQDTVVVPRYKKSVELGANLNGYYHWEGNQNSVSKTYKFAFGDKDSTYKVYAYPVYLCSINVQVVFPVKVVNYLPLQNTTDTTIAMKLGDSIDVAFYDNASTRTSTKIARESNKQAIDTINSIAIFPPIGVVGAGVTTVYTFKAQKVGIDTVVWNRYYISSVTGTKRIIFNIKDTIKPFFTLFTDTVIKVQYGTSFNVALLSGVDKGIQTTTGGVQLIDHQNNLLRNTVETSKAYDVYTFKAINVGEDVITWNNGTRKIQVQLIDTINLGATKPYTCTKTAITLPQDTIVVPTYQKTVELGTNLQGYYHWNGNQNTVSQTYNYAFDSAGVTMVNAKLANTGCTYTLVEYPVKVVDYFPLLNTMDTTIQVNLGDKFDVTFGLTPIAVTKDWKIQSESFKNGIDTITIQKYQALMGPLFTICTLKSVSVGVDTLVWTGMEMSKMLTKRIIVHTVDPNNKPLIITNDTVIKIQVGKTFSVAQLAGVYDNLKATTGGVQLLGQQVSNLGNAVQYDVFTFKAINQGEDVITLNNGAIKILVQIIDTIHPLICTMMIQLQVQDTVVVPRYQKSVELGTNLQGYYHWEGNQTTVSKTYTYSLGDVDSVYMVYAHPVYLGCSNVEIVYPVKVINKPFVNSTDTTIFIKLGETFDVAFGAGKMIANWSIVKESNKQAIDTISSIMFNPNPQIMDISYQIFTLRTKKVGVDTLVWQARINGEIYLSKRIIVNIIPSSTDTACPPIAMKPINDLNICAPQTTGFIDNSSLSFYYTTKMYFSTKVKEIAFPRPQDGNYGIGKNQASMTVIFDNGCAVKLSQAITVSQVPSPLAPKVHDYYFEPNDVKSMNIQSEITNSYISWICSSQDTFTFSGNAIELKNPIFKTIGQYPFNVVATDSVTHCYSAQTTIVVNIMNPSLPSISGNVLANGSQFSNGIVQLFEQKGSSYSAVSTQTINTDGTFKFKWLTATNKYLIRALPNDVQSTYVPSYYVSSTTWQDANVITLKGTILGLHVSLLKSTVIVTGTGSITGNIAVLDQNFAATFKSFEPITMTVHIMQNGKVVAYALTDANGNYTVDNLPDGSYQVSVEEPGYSSVNQTVAITNGSTSAVNFVLNDGKAELNANASIKILASNTQILDVILYPNPAIDIISIQTDKSLQKVEIMNIAGAIVLESGSSKTVSIGSLPQGMYIVKMITNDETILKTVIKQ